MAPEAGARQHELPFNPMRLERSPLRSMLCCGDAPVLYASVCPGEPPVQPPRKQEEPLSSMLCCAGTPFARGCTGGSPGHRTSQRMRLLCPRHCISPHRSQWLALSAPHRAPLPPPTPRRWTQTHKSTTCQKQGTDEGSTDTLQATHRPQPRAMDADTKMHPHNHMPETRHG